MTKTPFQPAAISLTHFGPRSYSFRLKNRAADLKIQLFKYLLCIKKNKIKISWRESDASCLMTQTRSVLQLPSALLTHRSLLLSRRWQQCLQAAWCENPKSSGTSEEGSQVGSKSCTVQLLGTQGSQWDRRTTHNNFLMRLKPLETLDLLAGDGFCFFLSPPTHMNQRFSVVLWLGHRLGQ